MYCFDIEIGIIGVIAISYFFWEGYAEFGDWPIVSDFGELYGS